jgi:hypothetical protein
MVVLVPTDNVRRPPLFGVLHHDNVAVATLRVEEYSWWTLGATCVHSVVSIFHKHLEGRWFPSLAAAAQLVHQEIFDGMRTEYMQTVWLWVRGSLADIILGDAHDISRDSLALAHINSRVVSLPSKVGDGHWLPVGKGRPYIPHDMPSDEARNARVWASYTPSRQEASDRQSEADVSARAHAAPPGKRRKKRRRKPPTERGAVVWDGDATSVPPVALVIIDVRVDPGDERRPCATLLHLQSLEPEPPPPFWKRTTDVCNFDEQLPVIYRERRMLLEAHDRWEQTVATVKRAMLQRLLAAPRLAMSELWSRRLAMGDEPCPVTDQEAVEWVQAYGAADQTEHAAEVDAQASDGVRGGKGERDGEGHVADRKRRVAADVRDPRIDPDGRYNALLLEKGLPFDEAYDPLAEARVAAANRGQSALDDAMAAAAGSID